MEELIQQVKVLAETVKAMVERQDTAFKTMQEIQRLNTEATNRMNETADHLETVVEALTQSLAESDSQLDDLAKIAAGLITLQKTEQTQQQGQQGG